VTLFTLQNYRLPLKNPAEAGLGDAGLYDGAATLTVFRGD